MGVAAQVRLPELMAEAYGSPNRLRPDPPVPVAGGGWLHADLGAPGDREAFARCVAALPPDAPAAAVAAAAQEWRLPVCDYRPRGGDEGPQAPFAFSSGAPVRPPRRGLRVLDLTNMWAGPLCTWLLAGMGAEVVKVEPSFRPDGFRALDGGGIHPDGVPCAPGADSAMWNALNHAKVRADLDLRAARDRARFLEMAAAADVVVDSFSPRVMPNFGLELPPGPLYVSMPAFPPGPQRDWVAYGTGVHARSGLGELASGDAAGGVPFAAAAVSYPDPIAGLTACLAILAALAGRRRGAPTAGVEVSLAAALGPLAGARTGPPGDDPLLADPCGLGARLLAAAGRSRLLEERPVCGRPRLHPRPFLLSKENLF